jgi:hypothetical protein
MSSESDLFSCPSAKSHFLGAGSPHHDELSREVGAGYLGRRGHGREVEVKYFGAANNEM